MQLPTVFTAAVIARNKEAKSTAVNSWELPFFLPPSPHPSDWDNTTSHDQSPYLHLNSVHGERARMFVT